MRKILIGALAVALLALFSQPALAAKGASKYAKPAAEASTPAASEGTKAAPEAKSAKASSGGKEFPEKGWHKGVYVAANVGMMQVTNDTHVVTGVKFNGPIDPAFGLTIGWDVNDWIGPMVQINYATASSTVGNGGAAIGPYPAGTFPTESARQHVLDFSIFVKATAPAFTQAAWQPKGVKILPYVKLGGTGHALFVNATTNANKVGAFGGGPAVGLGCEFYVWKGLFLALDATENIIIQKAYYTTIAGINTKVTDGGLKGQFELLGMFGWHF